jgi:hypothetical protein
MKTIYLIQDFTGFEPRVFATEEKTVAEKVFQTALEKCEKEYNFVSTEKYKDERVILIEYQENSEDKGIIFKTSVINLLEKGEDEKGRIIRPDNNEE